jgi:hypothetical protein
VSEGLEELEERPGGLVVYADVLFRDLRWSAIMLMVGIGIGATLACYCL